MITSRSLLLGAAMTAALTVPATAQDADTVVATVGGTEITLGHMIVMAERLPEQYSQMPDQQLFDGILEQLVQQAALAAKQEELSRTGKLMLENQERALFAGEAVQDVADAAVTDEALQAAYDAQYADAEATQEYNASHILVETEDEAKALIEEINGGADFAELAKEKSTGPSGPKGGELGWFGPGMMVKPFEDAVMTLEPGEISEPIQTQFGWHVVKLNEVREKEAPKLEEVRDELAAGIQQAAVEEAISKATADVEVDQVEAGEIDPAAIRNTGLLD